MKRLILILLIIISLSLSKASLPNISVEEMPTVYRVKIESSEEIQEVKYAYGLMPNVYIVPFIATNDSLELTSEQLKRLNVLKNNIKYSWDNLTNFSHPLNFTFYTSPIKIKNYSTNQGYSKYFVRIDDNLNDLNVSYPAILVTLDVKDYFPSQVPSNSRTTVTEHGLISEIYLNGFSSFNTPNLSNYEAEIFPNILLHELAHSFIFLPSKNKLFWGDHPGSFTDRPDFWTYNAGESPTGNEGYYEVYSILNQLRPYLLLEDIKFSPRLSILEKMFLGIVNPYETGNYTFYSGNITKIGDKYVSSQMIIVESASNETATNLYNLSDDSDWWEITKDSDFVNMNLNTSFDINKSIQNSRALWIFVNTSEHPRYFQVFNFNSQSLQKNIEPGRVYLLNNSKDLDFNQTFITLTCNASENVKNITLYTNASGTWQAVYTNNSGNFINYTITLNQKGRFIWNCLAYTEEGNAFWGELDFQFSRGNYLPKCSKFSKNLNFSDYTKEGIQNLSNVFLEIDGFGKIIFLKPINFENMDLDANVYIENKKIGINSNLEPNLNTSAQIIFYNIPFNYPLLYRNGEICNDCTFIGKSGFNATYNVSHFSNYTVGINSLLSVSNSGPKKINDTISFYANYTNISGNLIEDASCNISFNEIKYQMNETNNYYVYNASFESSGNFQYNISCAKSGFESLNLSDNFDIFVDYPITILNFPLNNKLLNSSTIMFNFTVYGNNFRNATLYTNFSGTWKSNNTNQSALVNGSSSEIVATGISDGNYLWAIYTCNLTSCRFSELNGSFILDATAPVISLISPENNSALSENIVNFYYNVSDSNTISNCSLILDDANNETHNLIQKNVIQNFTKTLADGTYNWSIVCCDAINCKNSGKNIILISVSEDEGDSGETGGGGGGGGSNSGSSSGSSSKSGSSKIAPSKTVSVNTIKEPDIEKPISYKVNDENPKRESRNILFVYITLAIIVLFAVIFFFRYRKVHRREIY
ncbi:MAG: hypothetical protein ACOYT4_03095 [Nanoarchaeota archaeon]